MILDLIQMDIKKTRHKINDRAKGLGIHEYT